MFGEGEKPMHVALYLRRSTNEYLQPQSLNVQEERLREYAARNNLEVVDVFADSASGVSIKRRKDFQRLLQIVQNGAPFQAVLVRDVTRWGRFQNVDEGAYWEVFMLLHNVKVIYAEELFDDAPRPYDALLKVIRRVAAAEFSREKSRLVQAALASCAKQGFRVNGLAPYGMQRILVKLDGQYVRTLRPGERKESSSHRVKLMPRNGRAARTVREIFTWFTEDGLTLGEIAERLNAKAVPTARGKRWQSEAVKDILVNPAYAGINRVTFKASANFSSQTSFQVAGAWKGIVSDAQFAAADARIGLRRRKDSIDDRLRLALKLWKWNADAENVTWESIRDTFPNGAVSIEAANAISPNISAELAELAELFTPNEATPTGFRLKNIYDLGVRYSFPQLSDGRICWDFRVSRNDTDDSTILIGLSPPPDVRAVEVFIFFTRRLRRSQRNLHPEIAFSDFARRCRVTWPDAAKRIERYLYSGPRAEAFVMEAMRGATLVNAAAIGRSLGWPEVRTYQIYARLRNRGVHVPQLVWSAGRRRVQWLCDACGKTRTITLRGLSRNKSGLCKKCYDGRRRATGYTDYICRACGKPQHLSRRKKYAVTPPEDAKCRSCASNGNMIRAIRESRRRVVLLRKAYRRLATEIVNVLRKKRSPEVEPINGMRQLVSFAKPDGTRRFGRLRIRNFETAITIVNRDRSFSKRLARRIAADADTWYATRRRQNLARIQVDNYLLRD
jgi:hypothetical protein